MGIVIVARPPFIGHFPCVPGTTVSTVHVLPDFILNNPMLFFPPILQIRKVGHRGLSQGHLGPGPRSWPLSYQPLTGAPLPLHSSCASRTRISRTTFLFLEVPNFSKSITDLLGNLSLSVPWFPKLPNSPKVSVPDTEPPLSNS